MSFDPFAALDLDPALVRLAVVLGLLGLLRAAELRWPRRGAPSPPRRRLRNLLLATISSVLVFALIPLTTVAFAASMQTRGIGLLHGLPGPPAAELLFSVVLLDLAIYWQHRWMHRLPPLWRLHRVHHSDTAFDVTLGLRFHPGEILLSILYKLALIALLGIDPVAITIYEILLAAFALFTHGDLRIPAALDARLRLLLVTPDWHRVHHSVYRRETDSNYGNILTLWDHLFRSAVAQPADGHLGMRIGLDRFRSAAEQTLVALLRQPLQPDPTRSWKG